MSIVYEINYTDPNKNGFLIKPDEVNGPGGTTKNTSLTLYGTGKLNYGEGLNENLLHLLENFASPANPTPLEVIILEASNTGAAGTHYLVVSNDYLNYFTPSFAINITNSTAGVNDGSYTVASATYDTNTDKTTIVLNESLPAAVLASLGKIQYNIVEPNPNYVKKPWTIGQFWHNTSTNQNYIYQDIGSGILQWKNIGFSIANGPTPPANPSVTDLWYDSTINTLKIYANNQWEIIGSYVSGGSSAPTNPSSFDFWYDSSINQLKIYANANWESVAERYVLKSGDHMSGDLTLGGTSSNPGLRLGAVGPNDIFKTGNFRMLTSGSAYLESENDYVIHSNSGNTYLHGINQILETENGVYFRQSAPGHPVAQNSESFYVDVKNGNYVFRGEGYHWDGNITYNKVWHEGNDGQNSGLDADRVWGYQPASSSIPDSLALRDSDSDIRCRLIRSEFLSQNVDSKADTVSVAYRKAEGTGTDNYIRFMKRPAIKEWLRDTNEVIGGCINRFANYTSTNLTIPWDNTQPQITEGNYLHQTSYTPRRAVSEILIEANFMITISDPYAVVVFAIFEIGNPTAIGAMALQNGSGSNINHIINAQAKYYNSNQNNKQFQVRFGVNFGTVYIDGSAIGPAFGATHISHVRIMEFTPYYAANNITPA